MTILALDLSLTHTGWCILHADGYEVGSIIPGKLRGYPRVAFIMSHLLGLLGRIPHDTPIIIEGYSYGSRGQAVFDIAELGGIVRYHLWQEERTVVEVAPSALKKFATGKGNADKGAMLATAIRKWGYDGSDHNEADAIALAHFALDTEHSFA